MSTVPELDDAEEDALLQSDETNSEKGEDLIANENLSDDDDDDDDLDDENEDNLFKEYTNLLSNISTDSLNYDLYLKLTEIAHKLGDLDKVRESYTLFSNVFPLAPDIWKKYIQIEKNISMSEAEIDNVISLCQKALADYFSSDIALELAELIMKLPDSKASSLWLEILGTYALDCRHGQQLFKLYRNFNDELPLDNEEKQNNYIESYIKELRIPLYDMENSYIDFKVFYEKNKEKLQEFFDWEKVDKYYKRAKEDLQKMIPFEERLKNLEQKFYQERASIYMEYIKMADDELEENVIQILYERMVTDCCLNDKCWLEYIDFILKRDEDGKPENLEDFPVFEQSALDINIRALRNCTWNDKLYIKKILILEEMRRPRQDIQEAFEKALEIGFSSPEPYVSLWLEYLTYLRRNSNYNSEKDVEILRKNFDLCWNALGKQWGVLADCNCEILQFWGRLEYGPFKNPEKGKELWCTVMDSSDNTSKSALWIEFINMEMRFNPDYARKLFKKALSTNLDNAYSIVSAWIRFERCNGTQNNLDYCQKYCENFLTDLAGNYKLKSQKFKSEHTERKGIKRKSFALNDLPTKKIRGEEQDSEKGNIKFVKPSSIPSKTSKVFKDHENDEIDLKRDHLRIFLSNLDYSIIEEDIKEGLSELDICTIDLIKAANGRSRGFGYLELSSEDQVQKALSLDGKMLKGRPMYISSVLRDKEKRQKFKYSDGIEPKKVFVKGLPYETTKEELQELFEPFGKISSIRIVYHKSGKPKGIAYIEYEDETSASLAILKLDGLVLKDFKINVAISAPPPKPVTKSAGTTKMLGIGGTKSIGSQKPRMSLIPTSVRKNLTGTVVLPTSQENGNTPLKSNDDFRKLLNN